MKVEDEESSENGFCRHPRFLVWSVIVGSAWSALKVLPGESKLSTPGLGNLHSR